MRTRRHASVLGFAFALAVLLSLTAPTAPPAAADADGGVPGGSCSGSHCSVSITFSGSSATSTPGATVPPDCWYEDWASVQEGFVLRVVNEFVGWLFPGLAVPLSPIADYKDALRDHKKHDDWRWYRLHCKDGIDTISSGEALSIAENTQWFNNQTVARQDLLVGPATSIPGAVSVQTLLEAAQDAFTIPEPEVTQSPIVHNSGGATLVNLDTWFWADNTVETHSITATAGPVSVTLTAKNDGYVLTSPFGSAQCTHEQFTTAWSAGADASAGCTLVFDRASPGAGHEVQVTSRWDVEWTATGLPGTHTLDPLTPSTTFNVPVTEAGAVVTGVG